MTTTRKTATKRSVHTRSTPRVSESIPIQSLDSSSEIEESPEQRQAKSVKIEEGSSAGEVMVLEENDACLDALDDIRLTKSEFLNVKRVLRYPFTFGKVYPLSLYDEVGGLEDFNQEVLVQGWKDLLADQSEIYPVQLAQFWGTLRIENRVLKANFGEKVITISMEEIGEILGLACSGEEITAWGGWQAMSGAMKKSIKKTLDPKATESSVIEVSTLSSLNKLWFNVVHNVLIPRKKGLHKLHVHDILILHHVHAEKFISLPFLMLSEIQNAANRVLEPQYITNFVLPYSMWLSRILKAKGVVPKNAITLPSCRPLTTDIMRLKMKILTAEGDLVRSVVDKGKRPMQSGPEEGAKVQEEAAGIKVASEKFVDLDIDTMAIIANMVCERLEIMLESKLNQFEDRVMSKIDVGIMEEKAGIIQASMASLSDKLTEVVAELSKSKDEVAFSMAGAIHKIGQMQHDVSVMLTDSQVMKQHGRDLVTGLNEAVGLVRQAATNPTERHTALIDRLRAIHEDTQRCKYLLQRNHVV